MTTRGYAAAELPRLPEDDGLLTMADVEAMAERLGLLVVTDGNRFEYARPGLVPAGWRVFRMVQKSRPLAPEEPRA